MTDNSESIFVCRKCNDTFPSRNKLFRHVRSHASQRSTNSKTEDSAANTSSLTPSNSCCSLAEVPAHFVYVLGGRLRGRTLNAVWRFSSARHVWEDCPAGRMLENRGSHGAATVDEVIYVVGGSKLQMWLILLSYTSLSCLVHQVAAACTRTYRHARSLMGRVGSAWLLLTCLDTHLQLPLTVPIFSPWVSWCMLCVLD